MAADVFLVTADGVCKVCPEFKAKEPVRKALMEGAVAAMGGKTLPFRNVDHADPVGRELMDFVKAKTGKRAVPALVLRDGNCKRVLDPMDIIKGNPLPDACEV